MGESHSPERNRPAWAMSARYRILSTRYYSIQCRAILNGKVYEWVTGLERMEFRFFPLLFLSISVFFADSLSTERIFDERSIFIHNRNETLWQNRVNINKGRRINLKRYIYFFACSRNSSANRMAETITALRRHSAVPTGWCWSRGGLATTDRPTGWRAEEKER